MTSGRNSCSSVNLFARQNVSVNTDLHLPFEVNYA